MFAMLANCASLSQENRGRVVIGLGIAKLPVRDRGFPSANNRKACQRKNRRGCPMGIETRKKGPAVDSSDTTPQWGSFARNVPVAFPTFAVVCPAALPRRTFPIGNGHSVLLRLQQASTLSIWRGNAPSARSIWSVRTRNIRSLCLPWDTSGLPFCNANMLASSRVFCFDWQ